MVHPGIPGDRGPSALDWAILNRETRWGVTVLQANAEMDAGDIWAHANFPMRDATKASLYRNEVTEAAVEAVIAGGGALPASAISHPGRLIASDPGVRGALRPLVRQSDRSIDWQQDDTETVLRKMRSADGFPGVRDRLFGRDLFLYDAHAEHDTARSPRARCSRVVAAPSAGQPSMARSGSAICATRQAAHPFKLPATRVLADDVAGLARGVAGSDTGYRDIWYEEEGDVGYLYFPFYNGAMGTDQCERLRQAYAMRCERDTRVIVLMGGPDYWSNGMNLNLIEAAESAADESWRNINAMDDLALEIINTESHLTVAALQGNAGAGGVFLARAADEVWARGGVILNPHYKDMGNLYGSEYWSYLLPRYAGAENAERITQARLPMGTGRGNMRSAWSTGYWIHPPGALRHTRSNDVRRIWPLCRPLPKRMLNIKTGGVWRTNPPCHCRAIGIRSLDQDAP